MNRSKHPDDMRRQACLRAPSFDPRDLSEAWLTDGLGLKSVDAGGGWLIFALPPAGRVTKSVLPSGGRLGLYEPRHASPLFR